MYKITVTNNDPKNTFLDHLAGEKEYRFGFVAFVCYLARSAKIAMALRKHPCDSIYIEYGSDESSDNFYSDFVGRTGTTAKGDVEFFVLATMTLSKIKNQ